MKAAPSARDLLAKTPLYGALDAADRDAVAAEMRETRFDAGQLIFSRGDSGAETYLVAEGRVKLSILTGEGRELSFAQIGAGSLFGEIAMLDGGTRTADATAVTRVAAFLLTRGAWKRVAAERPAVAEAMTRFLCARLREADHQLETIALYPIEGRLARFLLAAAAQKGERGPRAVLEIDMSQSDLALLVGASRPKVNTALSLLESSGAIRRSGTRFDCNLEELRTIAGAE